MDRSENMRAVRSKDTKPEKAVRSMLHRLGYRFRLHRSDMPGKPDLVFPSRRKVIFVNGCFWHMHDACKGKGTPSTNAEFWRAKRKRTVERDQRAIEALKEAGWKAYVVWECALKTDIGAVRAQLVEFLSGSGGRTGPVKRSPKLARRSVETTSPAPSRRTRSNKSLRNGLKDPIMDGL
jgi:DNA mismatch endonuclease, patch repair protein